MFNAPTAVNMDIFIEHALTISTTVLMHCLHLKTDQGLGFKKKEKGERECCKNINM